MEYMNSIYYTFSTIAQVLAGFIALSGVFVFFKLKDLVKIQLAIASRFSGLISNVSIKEYHTKYDTRDIDTAIKSESVVDVLSEMDFALKQDKVIKSGRVFNRLREYQIDIIKTEIERKKLIRLTSVSIISGVVEIMLSIIVLGFTELLNNYHLSIIITGTILVFIPVTTMTLAILLSLKDFKILSKLKLESEDGNTIEIK